MIKVQKSNPEIVRYLAKIEEIRQGGTHAQKSAVRWLIEGLRCVPTEPDWHKVNDKLDEICEHEGVHL